MFDLARCSLFLAPAEYISLELEFCCFLELVHPLWTYRR